MTDLKKGLIIRREHCQKILDKKKTYEMRSRRTNFRGRFGLIIAGTKKVFGEATLIASHETKIDSSVVWAAMLSFHQCQEYMPQWPYAWVLGDVVKYKKPIPYNHKNGQVAWVNL